MSDTIYSSFFSEKRMKNPSRGRFIASMLSVGGVYIFLKGMYINTMVETAQKSNAVKEDVMKAAKETYDASMRDGIKILPPEKPNCIKMIEGDNSEIKKAKDYMSDMPFHPIEDSQYINMTSNCALFIQNRGYLLPKVTQEEKHFPIAYSILTYKDVHQTERLLRSVYRPQNTYCIHVDQKASDTMRSAMSSIAKCFPNVFLASDPVKVIYAGYSRLLADIHCMQDVLKRKEKWKYYINLASQAFPLKSNREIVKILKVYNGSNDIEGIVGPRLDGIRRRFEFHFDTVFKNGQYIVDRTEKRKSKPPHNLSIVRGSAYGIFSRAFVHFIVNNNIAKDFLEWTKDTYSPDEFYWSTLHHVQSNPHLHTPGGYAGMYTLPFIYGVGKFGNTFVA